jgi:hypothetical protein
MSSKELFDMFYAVPNPHFNAFFKASTGDSEKHPLADLIRKTASSAQENTLASAEENTLAEPTSVLCELDDHK